jgi:hypothetical protein
LFKHGVELLVTTTRLDKRKHRPQRFGYREGSP